MSDENRQLHDQQREAAEAPDPVIAVLAGPGSGKTRTLSARARWLLLQDHGSHALLLTFMNKAAAEMKARALTGAPFSPDRVWAGTFHAFCAKLLRDHHELAGLAADFDVLDAEDAKELAACAGGSSSDLSTYDRLRSTRQPSLPRLEQFIAAYERDKADENTVDFTDLVVKGAEVLESHVDLASAYGQRYRHLLIDEFQDTDAARFAIVRALAPHVATISMFADDDQAIMSFAGADRGNVDRFVAELNARRIPLTVNYRSREAIVDVANRLIAADPTASGRAMHADRPAGRIEALSFFDEQDEAAGVVDLINDRLGERELEDIVVLARTGYRADAVAAGLVTAGIPLSDWRGDIIDGRARRTVAACMSVLRPRIAGRHEVLLCDLANRESTRLSDTTAVLESLSDHRVGEALSEFRQAAFAGAGVVEVVTIVAALVEEQRPRLAGDVGRLREAVVAFTEHDPNFSLEHLLTELALGAGGQAPTSGGGVKVATLHRTKGLQWPVVVVIGMEDGCLPDYRANNAPLLSEERRLCFVGVSRAEDELWLTRAQRTHGWRRMPSRFLAEMGLCA